MCQRCSDIEKLVEKAEWLARRTNDKLTINRLWDWITELDKEKSDLHTKPAR
jgi:hypothetical protein